LKNADAALEFAELSHDLALLGSNLSELALHGGDAKLEKIQEFVVGAA
jgi:hypothetical protein